MAPDVFDALADYLVAHSDELLRRWRDEVRRDPGQPANRLKLDGPELDDHLPSLIGMLATCLRGRSPEGVEKEGAEHGHQRRRHGYAVTELLGEMTVFRRVLMAAIERDFQAAPPRLGPEALADARLSVLDLLDSSVHASVAQYTREAEAERDEAHARVDEATRRLQDLNVRLEEAHVQKDRFISVLSHELRNPLTPILNATHVLKRIAHDDKTTGPLHAIIERQVQHLSRLVDDLLDMNRIAYGKLELRREIVSLESVVTFAVETSQVTFGEKGVRLALDLGERSIPVFADGTRLSQVVMNLLANAAKFTPPGGSVTVSLRADGDDAVISVADDGAGIAPELIAHVFEPFEQGNTRLARSSGGLGLGLMIARGLVEAHGGRIEAHSAGVGHGATFVVRLPIARADASAAS